MIVASPYIARFVAMTDERYIVFPSTASNSTATCPSAFLLASLMLHNTRRYDTLTPAFVIGILRTVFDEINQRRAKDWFAVS